MSCVHTYVYVDKGNNRELPQSMITTPHEASNEFSVLMAGIIKELQKMK